MRGCFLALKETDGQLAEDLLLASFNSQLLSTFLCLVVSFKLSNA